MGTVLFQDWTDVNLDAKDHIPRDRLDFPRMAFAGELPDLLTVRSPESGRTLITGAAWWGDPGLNPEIDVVRASPTLLQALERRSDEPSGERHPRVKVRRARWYDIVLYARGFWMTTWLALLGALAAVVGAGVAFVTGTAPLGWALLLLVLVCGGEIVKALKSVSGAARGS